MYIPNFIENGQTFCGWTYGRTFPPLMLLDRLGGVDLKMGQETRPCPFESQSS